MGQSFVITHGLLLRLYADAVDGGSGDEIAARLEPVRDAVRAACCSASLIAYERYLDLIALRLAEPGLKDRLTLLSGPAFQTGLRADPSQPFNLIGEALCRLREGDRQRARQLLRRLAASRYPARRQAQLLLVGPLMQDLST